VYYSVIRWLSPKEARRKDRTSLDVCLGGPLVFDLDIADTDIVHYHDGLESAFQTVTKLRDFIEENWGYRKTRTVFSGNRGFHLYVDDFRLEDFVEKIDPLNREKQEERIRSQILKKVFDVGFSVDEKVTSDTRRIIRLPNTLHGSTGFLSARVDVSKRFALSDFIAFDSSKEVKIKVCTPINAFRIDDNIFGPFAKDKSYLVPEYLAVFLVAKGLSVVQS
jgi:DNA primase catalytic subunit